MKKVFLLLLVLFLFYFGFQIVFRYFDKGHIYEYVIKDDKKFEIKEVLTQNTLNEVDNYYIEIKVDNDVFNFQIYDTYSKATGIIKHVKYFSNTNYKCVLPYLEKNKQFTDMMCKKDDIYYYYNSIKGKDPELDSYAESILDFSKYEDKEEVLKKTKNIYVYDNLVKNDYLTLDYFKGIYVIDNNSKYKKIELFKKEKYGRDLSAIIDKYYLCADYDEEYEFHKFKVVNLENYKQSEIISNYNISFDSYIQGIVDNEVYIFDRTNKKQYKINIKNKEVYFIGDENGIKIYKNGEFIKGNAYESSQTDIMFSRIATDNNFKKDGYELLQMNGNVLSGYILAYKKVNNVYDVYRINVQNKDIITYLFSTNDIKQINSDYKNIYYKDDKYIKYFNETTGIKTIIRYNELEFNNKLKFYVYSK